jgi:integrative and conjugative element protein (TIGR02256 family)
VSNRSFFLPDRSGYVVFGPSVLAHMYAHAQRRFYQKEAGGQIFSRAPHDVAVVVEAISGPNSDDKRQRHGYVPDAAQATEDRRLQLQQGGYPVGLWHTHPEAHPEPSGLDHKTTKEWLDEFRGAMHGFLLVIVGNCGDPPNMAVWLARTARLEDWIRLEEN